VRRAGARRGRLASGEPDQDYATSFLRQATQLSGLARPISVCALERPEWLRAAVAEPEVEETTLEAALAYYATVE